MNNGWQTKKLVDAVAAVSTGPFGSVLHKSDYVDDGVPLVNPINIIGERIVPDPTKLISDATKQRLSSYVLQDGDIVVARRGEIGRCAVVGSEQDGWLCGTGSFFIRPSPTVDSQFLAHLIRSDGYREKLEQASTGTTMKNLSNTALGDLEISIPPLLEQRRIVDILDEAFEGIATSKANAEKNLQNARALFESHLQSVFTQRGEGWVERRLDEISKDFGRGKSKHRPRNDPKLYGGKYPFIQTGDVRNSDHVVTTYSQTYSEAGLAQSKLWPKGTLCITIAANIAETGILGFDACFPDSIIGVVVDDRITSTKYLEYLLRSFKTILQAEGKGSAQDNINMGTFENHRFPFPSLKVQAELVTTLDSLRGETQRLASIYQQKLAALDELKKSLLHHAFTGQL